MKKTIWGIASILAAGALVFGTLGCDSGNDDYVEENPTTTESLGSDSYAGAVWDFSNFVSGSDGTIGSTTISSSDTQIDGTTIDASTSGSASLVATNFKGKTNNKVLQSSRSGSASLAALSSGYQLTLTLDTASNIAVSAKGAGAAEAARYLAIGTSADDLFVYKDNLGSSKTVDFMIQGAPAGDYIIFLNGVSISKIDTSSGTPFAAAKGYTSNDDLTFRDDTSYGTDDDGNTLTTRTALMETYTLTLIDNESTDVTQDAVWSVVSGNATVTKGVVSATNGNGGNATVRARIGRFYKEKTVTFTKCTSQIVTLFDADNFPAETVTWAEASDDVKNAILTPTFVGNSFVTISNVSLSFTDDILASTNDVPTIAAKGSATSKYQFGVYWKDSFAENASEDTTVETLKFTVTPTGSSATIQSAAAQTFNGKGTGGAKVKITAGENNTATISSTKTDSVDSATFDSAKITGATDVTVEFQVESGKKGVSFGCEDLTFYFGE